MISTRSPNLSPRRIVTISTAVIAGLLVLLVPFAAQAFTKPISGAKGNSAYIEGLYGDRPSDNYAPLRTGTNTFGLKHIEYRASQLKAAGKTNNHEVTNYAKDLWAKALDSGPKGTTSWDGNLYSYQYKTPGGTSRTMCVVVDPGDYVVDYANYGYKGIVSAYWASGHLSTYDACTNRD